jgi:hypothetical protein
VIDFVDVHRHAARAWIAEPNGVQFHGSSSSSR